MLSDKCTVARRDNSYKDGITFSVRPLKERQIFEVQHPLGTGGNGWVSGMGGGECVAQREVGGCYLEVI